MRNQTTFGKSTVEHYDGPARCEHIDGEHACQNSADYVIITQNTHTMTHKRHLCHAHIRDTNQKRAEGEL